MPGTYKDVKDTSAVAMFKAVRNQKSEFLFQSLAKVPQPTGGGDLEGAEVFFLAWTTTPWTLPSNLGLTVGGNIDYVLVKTFNPYLHNEINIVLAKALLGKYFKEENENADFAEYKNDGKNLPYKIIAEFKGNKIEGCEYEQLLPYKANSLESIKALTPNAKPFRVLLGDFVTTEDGTVLFTQLLTLALMTSGLVRNIILDFSQLSINMVNLRN
jgi:isoleucyl-tRNA synthetase